ncbi:uncharacterized protein LOC128550975 [Mercenaria mercenaria]|uniref:uncharacterized protein LOC128550975 n=1 Tax=Mercenaria mercenaria TaxID=6596 RepID=UPI00234EAF1D|nr:uncharacterized protein LOC128550975 [Mercenaria mercenaria]
MFSQMKFYALPVILAGYLHLVIGETGPFTSRIYLEKAEAQGKTDMLNIDTTQSPIRELHQNKETNLQPEKVIDNLAKILSDLTSKLDMQEKHILSLQESVEELARSNSKNENSLKDLNAEVSELKRAVATKDDIIRSMDINFTRQAEETEKLKTEFSELQNKLNGLQSYISKDESGREGMQFQEYENRSIQPNTSTTDSNGSNLNTSTGTEQEDRQNLSEDILLNRTIGDYMRTRAHIYHNNVGRWTRGVSQVAFHAVVLTPEVHHLGRGQTVVFETVRLNLNGGYNRFTGIFTASKPGLYLFSLSVLSHIDPKSKFNVCIVKNGVRLVTVYGHGDSPGKRSQGSVTVVMQLNKGDHVWAKNVNVHDASIGGWGYTSFTGVLLSAI